MAFTNPIITGFYPDPSCIRVGDTFYLANSSFQFFPGIPIHKSKDLVNWEHIGTFSLVTSSSPLIEETGNAFSRPSQLPLDQATTKINNAAKSEIFTGGIYAPTLRYHERAKTFYIVCTMLTGSTTMAPSDDFQPRNFILATTDIANDKSWSKPVYFDFHGIDPSLFFMDLEDGSTRVYVQGSWMHGYNKTPATVIRQAEIDVSTGALLSPWRDIWAGATEKVPEGPHIYHREDGWFYLLIAEGGTHGRHKITMARARDIWGPYEGCERNPMLTAEGSDAVVQCVGHGDLFQDAQGKWWCVMLGRRQFKEHPGCWPLGRETFMVPVEWEEGEFPVFGRVEVEQRVSRGRQVGRIKVKERQWRGVELASPLTVYLRTPDLRHYEQQADEILLFPTEMNLGVEKGTVSFVGQRQTSLDSIARVSLPLDSADTTGPFCGLTVYKDTFRFVALEYSASDSSLSLQIQQAEKPLTTLSSVSVEGDMALQLTITSRLAKYTFECVKTASNGQTESVQLGEVPCSALSGDDFTGTVYAIYAHGDGGPARFKGFEILD
ncbi:uncharacterized protein DSM5745_06284 [Aspergillus mulundensis]|uniref:Beta-xylosidase C-terminal Concanavalin A-like domain-containing protein n=1 Tax=Aspergillus mulundensis TaxID=1810919 RepID=A0A3D8RQC9_9EURO|nr:Uncharacterized protein DSM5745_06284 [Aspergillus mulundensis]RDW76292.1 Uncharacterized protein DSM5745_06284 [Aspergillus mulundensis]